MKINKRQNDNRLLQNRDNNSIDFFNSNQVSKRIDFRQSDGFYDTPDNQTGGYSLENNNRAVENIFGGIGQKNKFTSYLGNNNSKRQLFENNSVMVDNSNESLIFRRDEQKPNSRSTSFLGDSSYIFQTQQQDNNTFSNQNKNNGFNTSTPSQYSNGMNNKYYSNQTEQNKESPFSSNKYLNKSESKPKENIVKEYSHIESSGYKASPENSLKIKLQKCESSGDIQFNNQQNNYQDIQSNINQNKSQKISNSNEIQTNNNGKIQTYNNAQTKNFKDSNKGIFSRNQTEESFGYSPSQDTKSSNSTNNFDSFKSQKEQTSKDNQTINQEAQQSRKSKLSDFQQQWEDLNSFKFNSPTGEEKQIQEAFEKATNFSTGQIDFKSIKLSRTPLETIDIRQQLTNIDQNAKIEAYGQQIPQQEQSKIDNITPQILQKSGKIQNSTLKNTEEKDQQLQSKEIDHNLKEEKYNIQINGQSILSDQRENKQIQKQNKQNEYNQIHQYEDKQYKNQNQNDQSQKASNEVSLKQNLKEQMKIDQKQQVIINEQQQQGTSQNQISQSQQQTEKQKEQIDQFHKQVSQTKKGTSKDYSSNQGIIHKSDVDQQPIIQEQTNNIDKKSEINEQNILKQKISQENKNKALDEQKQEPQSKIIQVEQKQQIQNVTHKNSTIEDEKEDRVKQSKPSLNIQQQQTNKQSQVEQQQASQQNKNINQKQIPIINLPQNQTKQAHGDNQANQNSSRGQVDLSGIVQNIRSIKQDLQEKRKGKNTPQGNASKNSASVLQNDSSSTPSFKLNQNQVTEFSQVLQNENGKDLETIRQEIFSNFKKDSKESESQREQKSQIIQQNNKKHEEIPQQQTPKNKNKQEMDTIEEEQRTAHKESIDYQSGEISFQENCLQQNDMSFNGESNDMDELVQLESNNIEQNDTHNLILQQELSLDLIMRYQQLLNESSNASVKNLPLNYTKEMVNLAYSILQTVRNCSQIPQNEEEDYQQDQF